MTPEQFEQVERLFERARHLSPDEQAAMLAAESLDSEVHAKLMGMLAHHNDTTKMSPLGDTALLQTSDVAVTEAPGAQIGPYRLLERIGEGGFGVVWLAEQREPIVRRVALKVIKAGMDTKEVIARFQSERQTLAMLEHPRIARVFDAGATVTGRPYFVMEFVPGVSITQYCDTHRLTTLERLALFSDVCEAVQHAHSRGIIHRDLKPSNILVMMQDGKPMPKIIDFGISKATDQRFTENSFFTQHGQIIGTPEYMSPEQAEMSALDVDTRTDVYSLGVVLYELLVGALPFDPKTLRRAGYAEIQRIIREVEPHKPSTRLSTMGAQSTVVSERRRVDNKALQRILRGDLDWITMKALEKDRTRRYDTAAEFAADIGRYLGNEAIIARPRSRIYQALKFIRRHRTAVGLSAGLGMAIIVAATALVMRQRSETHLIEERATAETQRLKERAERVKNLIKTATEQMGASRNDEAEINLKEALRLEPENTQALLNMATVMRTPFERAHFDPAIAAEAMKYIDLSIKISPALPEAWNLRGYYLRNLGDYPAAVDAHRKGIQADRGFFANWVSLANTYVCLKDLENAERCLIEADALPAQQPDPTRSMRWHNLAALRLAFGKPEALRDMAKAVEVGPTVVANRLLEAKCHLLLKSAQDYEKALRAAIVADVQSPGTMPRVKRVLALAYLRTGDFQKAATVAQGALDLKDPVPAYPLLIMGLAEAGLGHLDSARQHREAATAKGTWPGDLEREKILGFIENGLLWFETAGELTSLRDELDAKLGEAKP